jgi:hypothetical protein
MTFTITQTYPGSREYLVTSVTKYFKWPQISTWGDRTK